MGESTARVWQVDWERARELPPNMEATQRALVLEGSQNVELGDAWRPLAELLSVCGIETPLAEGDFLCKPADVKRLARALEPLAWEALLVLAASHGKSIDPEIAERVGPHYASFRAAVLDTAARSAALAGSVVSSSCTSARPRLLVC